MNTQADVVYSTDGENFAFESVGDVLDALRWNDHLEIGRVYYEADATPLPAHPRIAATNKETP